MIPRSITLKGFLCYKDEQVIDLDGCDQWVFAGRNGSGKSAIFDAMRFALFKTHRGGRQDAKSLIHTEESELSVCFEFDLGTNRYRIRRAVTRNGTADRGVYRLAPQADGSERWPAVPETQSDAGLKQWVHDHVGLTDETFVASVLLLQGESDKLLKASPKARHDILAGILDLESFRRLHKRADDKRLCEKVRAESLRSQLQALPVIDAQAIAQAEGRLDEAAKAWTVADEEWKRFFGLKAQAEQWLGLMDRRKKALAQGDHFRQLIADSDVIAREWARLQELEAVVPAVRESITRRKVIGQLEAQSQIGEGERRASSRKLDLISSLAKDNRGQLETIVEEIERDQATDQAIVERQAALMIPMHRANQARIQSAEIRRLEEVLKSYPLDLVGRIEDLEEKHRHRTGWKAALPSLTMLARERHQLAEALGRRLAAWGTIEARTSEARFAEIALSERRAEESAARVTEGQARDRATEAITLARTAEARLAEFERLNGFTTCDRCGQDLTPEHFDFEAARRREELDSAAKAAQTAECNYRKTKSALEAAEAASAQAERSLREAKEAIKAANHGFSEAGRDAERHAGACRDAYERLDDAFRILVAAEPPDDWGATTFPEASDLEEGRWLAAEVEEVLSQLKAERGQLDKMKADHTLLEQARHTMAAVGLKPTDEGAESEHATLQAERESLARRLKGHEVEKTLAEQTIALLDKQARSLQDRLNETERKLAAARSRLEALGDEAARARASAPDGWREAIDSASEDEFAAWDQERQSLRAKDVATLTAELPQGRRMLEEAEADLEDLDSQLAVLPEEARCDPKEVTPLIERAERRREQADETRRKRQGDLDSLRQARDGRLALAEKTRNAESKRAIAERLAQLLGPRGLQRHLIRDAEQGIVKYANPILREISGGELELRLVDVGDDEPDHALQLEAIERIQGRTGTRGVEYLSGSQKFRVAVSLALAIGQYARGSKERPIESVIIDEGFGSLDRQGRDEMIEQLNALRGRLARIILVSHQEEFAEAFRDGYRFEVVDGSTVARPFHR